MGRVAPKDYTLSEDILSEEGKGDRLQTNKMSLEWGFLETTRHNTPKNLCFFGDPKVTLLAAGS